MALKGAVNVDTGVQSSLLSQSLTSSDDAELQKYESISSSRAAASDLMDEMLWKTVEKEGNSSVVSPSRPCSQCSPTDPLISALCWFTQTCLIISALHSCVAASPSSGGQIAFARVFCTIPSIPSVSGQY